MKLIKDLGQQYANENSPRKRRYGLYECPDCLGHFRAIKKKGKSTIHKCKSCSATKHGFHDHRLYATWNGEKARCNNKNATGYENYGGRGISISDEFMDFETWLNYVESLENAYVDTYTIDRIDNDGNYERGNLRWASKSTQSSNKRKRRK